MTTKSASSKKKTSAPAKQEAPPAQPSGLDMLRAAITTPDPSAAPTSVPTNSALASYMADPAIAGATRKGKSGVVKLGFDPKIAKEAREAAQIAGQIKTLSALFKVSQASMREYGADKRRVYNKAYRTDVTTVDVPYTVEVPQDANSDTPGHETRYVQVVCQNKYSVQGEAVLSAKEELGGWFDKLFTVTETKSLRPNAEELFRKILIDQGIKDDNLEKAMDLLFETKKKVDTVEAYESLEQEAPQVVRTMVSQNVTRVEPSLKFPSND